MWLTDKGISLYNAQFIYIFEPELSYLNAISEEGYRIAGRETLSNGKATSQAQLSKLNRKHRTIKYEFDEKKFGSPNRHLSKRPK